MAARLIGLLFLLSAVAKWVDIEAFAVQVAAYGIFREPWLVQTIALVTTIVEAMLGVVFLGAKRVGRSIHILTLALLSGFSLLVLYAWLFQNLSDCGCFGSLVSMSPPVSIAKNIVLIAMVLYAWRREGRGVSLVSNSSTPTQPPPSWGRSFWLCQNEETLEDHSNGFVWGRGVPSTVALGCLLTVVTVLGYSLQNGSAPSTQSVHSAPRTDDSARPFAHFVFEENDTRYDLADGGYLVALLSATCSHCEEETSRLNELPELFPDAPTVVGLCLGTEPELQTFREKTQPNFPAFLLEPLDFFQLIGQTPPRFVLVLDGKPLQHWDEHVPDLLQLVEAMDGVGML